MSPAGAGAALLWDRDIYSQQLGLGESQRKSLKSEFRSAHEAEKCQEELQRQQRQELSHEKPHCPQLCAQSRAATSQERHQNTESPHG